MVKVLLFKTTLTGVLGGLLNPGRSSLTISISPSLMTQISSLWGLLETLKVLIVNGFIVVLVSVGFKGRQACSLQPRVWMGSPLQALLSNPRIQIL